MTLNDIEASFQNPSNLLWFVTYILLFWIFVIVATMVDWEQCFLSELFLGVYMAFIGSKT